MTKHYTINDTVNYLNSVAGTKYSHADPYVIDALYILIKEGYGYDDFKLVIDKKWSDWKGTEYQQYVRPETLFGKKFKKYLHEQPRIAKSGIIRLAKAVGQAKQADWKLDC
jgi:uncharacterized phage protein (TIGR02220 family)